MAEVPVLDHYNIDNGVLAFTTTRTGGCSTGTYAAFNINSYCGDNMEAVAANRKALCNLLDIGTDRLVMPHQTHGTEMRIIDHTWQEHTPKEKAALLEGIDCVMTNVPELCVGVSTADCIPILLYDRSKRVVCAVHAGWRGTVMHITEKAIRTMAKAFSSQPEHIHAIIGPGISMKHFEVGEEVYCQFKEAGFAMEDISVMQEKWHIDLPECNKQQLTGCGIPETQIQMSRVCTFAQSDRYFSARRLGINSGRLFTGIMLKSTRT
ncbi:MAG: peptidoglycan editing factor PgeF [Prevotella sp.]